MHDSKIFGGLIVTLGHDNVNRAERSVDKQKIYWQLFWESISYFTFFK